MLAARVVSPITEGDATMAKSSKKPAPAPVVAAKRAGVSKAPVKTDVRNSPIPKIAVAAPKPVAKAAIKAITHDAIAQRAYEIHLSGTGGSETDNWYRAERELRGV